MDSEVKAIDLKTIVIPLTSKEEFPLWKLRMQAILIAHGAWDTLTSTDENAKLPKPMDNLLYTMIVMSLRKEDLSLVLPITPGDGHAAWKAVLREYERASMANKISLLRKLYSVPEDHAGDAVQAGVAIDSITDRLKALGVDLTEEMKISLLLSAAAKGGGAMGAIVASIEYAEKPVLYADAISRFKDASDRVETATEGSHSSATALRTKHAPQQQYTGCYICGGNHYARSCPNRKDESKPDRHFTAKRVSAW